MAEEVRATARELRHLARRMRGGLASLRAAAETLQAFPAMDDEQRRRLVAVVVEEAEGLGSRLDEMERLEAGRGGGEPARRRLGVGEVVDAVRGALASRGLECALEETDPGAAAPSSEAPSSEAPSSEATEARVEVDLEGLVRAAADFAGALRRDLAVSRCRLGARLESSHVLLDLAWHPEPGDSSRLHAFETAALEGREDAGLRPLARAHDGEAWFNLDRDGGRAHVRLLLPLADAAPAL